MNLYSMMTSSLRHRFSAAVLLCTLSLQSETTTPAPQAEQPSVSREVAPVLRFEQARIGQHENFLAKARNSYLVFSGQSEFHGSYRGAAFAAQLGIHVESGSLLFNGRYHCALTGGDKGRFLLGKDAQLLLGAKAEINQQMEGMILARPIHVLGEGRSSILELAPDFKADHMGWPDLKNMRPNGFSVLFIKNATLISHHTQSLPSVHKFSGNGNHTHHGVLVFQGEDAGWQVKSQPQVFDGVLAFEGRAILDLEEDLLFTGHFFEDSHCYFGSFTDKHGAPELMKRGPGKLIIMGTQLYKVPSVIRVQEGEMSIRTPTHNPGHYALTRYAGQDWDNLDLVIEEKGLLRLNPTRNFFQSRIRNLELLGTLKLGSVDLRVQQEMSLGPSASLEVPLHAIVTGRGKKRKDHPIQIGTTLKLNGSIRVTGTVPKGTYLFARAQQIQGQADWDLPEGLRLEQSATELILISE